MVRGEHQDRKASVGGWVSTGTGVIWDILGPTRSMNNDTEISNLV